MSFANSDFLLSIGGCILPLIGRTAFIKANSEDSLVALHQHCKYVDDHLKTNKYLLGEQSTVADYFVTGTLIGAYTVLHKVIQPQYPHMTRWFHEFYDSVLRAVMGDLVLLDLPMASLPGQKDNSTNEEGVDMQPEMSTAIA